MAHSEHMGLQDFTMRMKKYLASTLFTGLFIGAATLAPAQAQDKIINPQGTWSITKVDRSKQGAPSYCTLSRKYENGVVLSLARNETEEFSLAMDFQKPAFEKDKSLKINLQPGPGQLRAYDMMPTSDRAVVIRLGWDSGFFATLDKSEQMKVKIDEKSYAFAMPEIGKGQQDLKQCMDGLKAAKTDGKGANSDVASTKDVLNAEPVKTAAGFAADKTPEAAQAAAKTPLPETAANESNKSQSKGFFESLTEGFAAAKPKTNGDGEAPRRNFAKTAQEEKEIAVQDNVSAKAPAPDLIEPAASASAPPAAVTVAQAPVAAPSPAKPVAKEPAAAKAAAPIQASPEKEVAAVKSQPANAKTAMKPEEASAAKEKVAQDAQSKKDMEALVAQQKSLQVELENAKKDLATKVNAQDLATAEATIKELEIKNAQLQDTLRQSQTRIAETAINTETKSMRQIVDLQTRLEAAQKDNAQLAKQLESFKLKQEDSAINLVSGDWDLEQATKRYNEAEREIRRLGLQLEQERTSCNREKSQIEGMLFDPAVTEKKQIERLTQLQTDLDAANAKMASVQKQIDAAVAQQVVEKTKTLEADKAIMSQQIAALQKQVETSGAAASAGAQAAQQATLLQKSLAEKEALIATLQAQVTATAASGQGLKDAQAQIESLKSAMVQKDQQIAALQAAPKVDPSSSQQLASLQTQNQAMAQNIEAMKLALASKDKALADSQARIVAASAAPKADPNMMKQLSDSQAAMVSLKADNDALRDQNIVLRQQADKLQLQLSDVQSNGSARADMVASAQLQVDDLKRQLEMKDRQNATYQNQISALQQDNTQLKNRLTVSDSTRADNTSEVSELTRQVQSLQRQITDMQMQARSAQQAAYKQPSTPVAAPTPPSFNNVAPSAGTVVAREPVSERSSGMDVSSIKSLLEKSGLAVTGLQKTSSGFVNAENFSWGDSANVKGLASVRPMKGSSFQSLVDQYIAYQKGQCQGDFASMPSPSNGGSSKNMGLYEIACVGSAQSLSSSILFFEDQGSFIAIANQVPAEDMDVAMDSRDKIAGFVRGL